jgi:hypothetical protein
MDQKGGVGRMRNGGVVNIMPSMSASGLKGPTQAMALW